jgi:hypothetical protein
LNANHVKECTAIIIAPDWADYIKTHFTVIKGWANWQWFQYMQAINPSTPNLINKLCATSNKNSLTLQTKFWKSVVNHHPLCCFYSGNDLDVKTLKLDYYLPWSFVAHDHLSNIVPISRSIDLFRSHHIPSDGYLQKFVDLQHLALTTNHQHLPKSEWHQVVMSYLNDLSLETEGDLLNHAKLLNAYKRTLHYLQSLAIKQGFKDGWHY